MPFNNFYIVDILFLYCCHFISTEVKAATNSKAKSAFTPNILRVQAAPRKVLERTTTYIL